MITLTYVYHDCFVATTPQCSIVFDFWKDPTVFDEEAPGFLSELDRDKPLYVLVSHHHKDHFTKRIFSWATLFPKIHFILSKDTAKSVRHILREDSIYSGQRPKPEQVAVLRPGEQYSGCGITVSAFGSTDIGNSYVVQTAERSIFHAGDLNAWIWRDESTDREVAAAMKAFTDILATIALRFPVLDIAMFPVDSRIGTGYYTGAHTLVREIFVRHFFPMHFGLGDTDEERMKYLRDATRIELYANPERGDYIALTSPYSRFALSSPLASLPADHSCE